MRPEGLSAKDRKVRPEEVIEKAAFYVVREDSPAKFPRVTVCVARMKKDKTHCRGVAICSFSEEKHKPGKARNMAMGRAVASFVRGENAFPVVNESAVEVLVRCDDVPNMYAGFVPDFAVGQNYGYKAQYNVELTDKERMLLS